MSDDEQAHDPSSAGTRVSLFPVFLIVLVDVFGMTLVLPLLAIYAESFGASPFQATLLVSVYAGCQFLSGPLLGQASDRHGRKRLLILSQIGTFIGFIILARATTLWVIFLSRVIDGATAGNLSLAQAYIADHTEPADRSRAFALIGIAFGLGFFIGPTLTGYLSGRFGYTTPIYVAALMSATSILCTSILLRGGNQNRRVFDQRPSALAWDTYAQYFKRPGLRGRLFQFFFFMLSFSTFIAGFALFAERRFVWEGEPFGPREIGYVFGWIGLLAIFLQGGGIGWLVKRFDEGSLVLAGFIALSAAYVGLGVSYTVAVLLLVSAIAAFGHGVLRPVLSSLITQHAERHEQGVVLGLTQSIMSMASMAAPMAAGLLIEYGLLTGWAWMAAAFAAVGGLVAWRGLHDDALLAPVGELSGQLQSGN
jgi:DHA1 family tetracycline resistance protein-like MFS transporter